jgi:hypothetical protein
MTESERNEMAREQFEQQLEARPAVTRLEPSGDADHDKQNAEMFGLPVEDPEAKEKTQAKKSAKK